MSTINLQKQTQQLLDETIPGEQDVNSKIRQLLKAEYVRRLGRYRRTDLAFTRKYGMTFDQFIARSVAHQKGYAWDVEQDAMDWETAIGGIATLERKLSELEYLDSEPTE